MPRVLVTETIADAATQLLSDADVDVHVRTDLTHDQLVAEIAACDGLIVRSATKVTADVIEAGSRLKVIGRAGIGVDNVDVDAATRRGVVVVNAPQGNIISNAEHTIGLLLSLVRNIPRAHASLVGGSWERAAFMGTELHDKVLGIVGLGRVGTLVAQRCLAFGMRVIAHDKFLAPQRASRLGVELVDLDDLLVRADVVSLHVTMSPDSLHMLGRRELALCRRGTWIVNTSRGGVIDESALADAIRSGHIAGAALDVFEDEPPGDLPLFALPQVVVTPHLGGQTVEAQDKAGILVAEQVVLALRGDFTPNAVNVHAELPDSVKPFVPLAEKLGRLAQSLSRGAASKIEVSYLGRVGEEDTRILTLAVLRNYLQPTVQEPVTYVNANVIASERGVDVAESRSSVAADYLNLIRVQSGDVSVAGTLMGVRNEPRLVEVDGVPIEIAFAPYMAFFRYEDKPGVIHNMTGPLARSAINIADFKVGQNEGGGEAILGMSVDSPIPPDVFDEAMRAAGIPHGKFVVLS